MMRGLAIDTRQHTIFRILNTIFRILNTIFRMRRGLAIPFRFTASRRAAGAEE